jgi:hypothetical protein
LQTRAERLSTPAADADASHRNRLVQEKSLNIRPAQVSVAGMPLDTHTFEAWMDAALDMLDEYAVAGRVHWRRTHGQYEGEWRALPLQQAG